MNRYTHSFREQLDGFDFETLETSPHSIFALSQELEFIYFNPSWYNFAEQNKGNPFISEQVLLGSRFDGYISGDLKEFYTDKFREVLRSNSSWQHEYECSSPETYRVFHQIVRPLKNGKGIIVINSLKIEHQIDPKRKFDFDLKEYIQMNGFYHQCSNCRKTQMKESSQWDWIPALVDSGIHNISHTICPICFYYYWKA